jgi:hypothetical protein
MTIILSDIHPHLPSWTRLAASSAGALSYMPEPLNALQTPSSLKKDRHLRTFCLSFHHFVEKSARRILEDAMTTAEGIW